MDEAGAAEKLQGAAPKLAAWLGAYMRQQPSAPASTAGPGFSGPATKAVCIQVRGNFGRCTLPQSRKKFEIDKDAECTHRAWYAGGVGH